jgi:hypothetical protein
MAALVVVKNQGKYFRNWTEKLESKVKTPQGHNMSNHEKINLYYLRYVHNQLTPQIL